MAIGNLSITDKTDINNINGALAYMQTKDYPYNFINKNLNTTNIDEVIDHNYVAAISIDGMGTVPCSGWLNVVNFFSYHFITQIATTVDIMGGGDCKMYVRTRYANPSSTWGNWTEIQTNTIS